MSADEPAFYKSPSFIGACVGVVVAVALDLALGAPKGAGNDLVRFVGRFHPLVVHLPIGFLLLVAFAETLSLSPKIRPRVDPALGLMLPPLLVSAVGAFGVGLLLARDGGYPSKLVALHRNLTLSAVVGTAACVAAWSAHAASGSRVSRGVYRGVLGVTLGLISLGAHVGGSITRGDAYLTKYAPTFVQKLLGAAPAPAPPRESEPAEAGAEPLIYRDVVAHVIESRCVECHGPSTSKASLRLDSVAAMLKGGENGPSIVPGSSAKSSLVSRMLLPLDKDEHMPPEGKPGPTPGEIELIRFWIDRGANETLRVRDALPPDAAREALAKLVSSDATTRAAPPSSASPSAEPAPSAAPPTSSSAEAGASSPAPPAPVAVHAGLVWKDAVEPLLAARCGGCHGAEKQKGKLRVDSLDALLAGGKEGPAIVPGDAGRGTLLARMRLPIDDKDHMPPKKEAQLDASQIELVAYFIDHGAKEDLRTSSLPKKLLGAPPTTEPTTSPTTSPSAEPATAPSGTTPPPAPPVTPVASGSAPPVAPTADPSKLPERVALYASVVKPILDKRCGACHVGQNPSGDLDVDDLAAMTKSGALVVGDAHKSKLYARAALPLKDPDHMPPEGLPQTERGEVDAIELWIAKGADPEIVVRTASLTPDVAYAAAASFVPPPPSLLAATAPSAAPSASASPSSSAAPTASSSASPGPPSVEPGASGCAACAVSDRRGSVVASLVAALVLGAAFVARRRK